MVQVLKTNDLFFRTPFRRFILLNQVTVFILLRWLWERDFEKATTSV